MKRASFRLSTPTLGLTPEDGKLRPIFIPHNSVIEVVNSVENQQGMLEVDWNGVIVMLFAYDLRERGELVDFRAAASRG